MLQWQVRRTIRHLIIDTPNNTVIDLPFAFENAEHRDISSRLKWTDCHNVDSSSFEPYVESVTIIHSAQEFATVDTSLVRELIIPNNTCNEQSFVELDVSSMSVLERISIGENSLQSVSTVRAYDIPSLRSISIGRNSFSSSSRRLIDESEENQFYIMNCTNLNDIVIKDYCFSNYHDFVLSSRNWIIEWVNRFTFFIWITNWLSFFWTSE